MFQKMLRYTDALNADIPSLKQSGSKSYPKSIELAKVFKQNSNLQQILTKPKETEGSVGFSDTFFLRFE